MQPLRPTGFWSYTTDDDRVSGGRLSQLRRLLADELKLKVGRTPVYTFQDVAAIPPGKDWEREIDAALEQASFCIPIITPGFCTANGAQRRSTASARSCGDGAETI